MFFKSIFVYVGDSTALFFQMFLTIVQCTNYDVKDCNVAKLKKGRKALTFVDRDTFTTTILLDSKGAFLT